ncbi:hypothetical protein ALP13_00962 [Pseudomonas syringae pv. maculicola]|uniref:Uncharacterized protein n=1 Tax=Pseudomonas syringae pv. maculicola TaxID=59511 RepID=A0A3M6B7N3_PSEYM|nr:hypothetical protein ALP13_00962 [Pseudomonas syringae pv. maculicola]
MARGLVLKLSARNREGLWLFVSSLTPRPPAAHAYHCRLWPLLTNVRNTLSPLFSEALSVDIPELHKIDYTTRVDSLVETYAEIAEQAFACFLDEVNDPAAKDVYSAFDDPGGVMDQYERRRVSGIKTIVFAAMAIEAAAFEFSAMTLGDQIAKKLDKMDLEGKWMIATQLACGQSFPVNSPAMNGLNSLQIARNALVHHKSSPDDSEGRSVQKMMKRWADFEKDQVPNAFKTLVLLSLELDKLPNSIIGTLPYYGKDPFHDYPRHPGVKAVIERCRMIHSNVKGA